MPPCVWRVVEQFLAVPYLSAICETALWNDILNDEYLLRDVFFARSANSFYHLKCLQNVCILKASVLYLGKHLEQCQCVVLVSVVLKPWLLIFMPSH